MKKDNFLLGLLTGLVLPFPVYGILWLIDTGLKKAGVWNGLQPHENLYLLSIALNFLLIRFFMVKWQMQKTGRGMLLISILMVVAFFLLFFKQY
ncbi:MAG: hypothetical protein JXR71_01575 [Bacteroidales bacterium]|nr:hypothetical protein [Bacteroidales bacterium]